MNNIYLNSLVEPAKEKSNICKDNNLRYIGLEHLDSSVNEIRRWGEVSESISINNIFYAGDTLFGKLRPNLRKAVFAKFKGYCSTDILVLRPKLNIDPLYASYICQSEIVFGFAERTAIGTGMPRTSWKDICKINVFCPVSRNEQQKIAKILSTVDDVIEKTQEAIDKYKAIKAGMMQDLFTRGIDVTTGKLRPSYADAPQLYKETALGWVPKEWDVVELRTCSETGFKYGINAAAVEYNTTLPVYLRITDIDEEGHFVAHNKMCVNSVESKNYVLAEGEIVFARTGATVGKTYLYDKDDGELVYAGFLIKFSPNQTKLLSYYLKTYTETDAYKKWVIIYSSRSGQPGVNGKEYGMLVIPLPHIQEQQKIIESFIAINKMIIDEQLTFKKYQQLKQGLMSDLLTGKVQVKYEEEREVA